MMKNKDLFFLILIIILVLATLIVFLNFSVDTINFDVVVGNHVGFNLDSDKLHFGTVPPGNYADRDIFLTSEKKSKIYISIEDVDFVHPSVNNFIILPGEKRKVTMLVSIAGNAKPGLYEGKIKIYSRSL